MGYDYDHQLGTDGMTISLVQYGNTPKDTNKWKAVGHFIKVPAFGAQDSILSVLITLGSQLSYHDNENKSSSRPCYSVTSASPGNLLDIQNLRPYPRPKSESWEWGLVASILTYSPILKQH